MKKILKWTVLLVLAAAVCLVLGVAAVSRFSGNVRWRKLS